MNKYPNNAVEQAGINKEIVCKENGRAFHLTNNSDFYVQKVKVDGALITQGIRCDYALDLSKSEATEIIYLVELKGKNKTHACEQILETYKFFQKNYQTNAFNCRIVLSKDSAPNIQSIAHKKLLQLQKQNKLTINIKSQIIEEVV